MEIVGNLDKILSQLTGCGEMCSNRILFRDVVWEKHSDVMLIQNCINRIASVVL